MFEIKHEHLLKIAPNKLFQQGIKFCLENTLDLSPTWFRGNSTVVEKLRSLPREEWYEQCLKNYSLPYLSPCENPDNYELNSRNYHTVMRDVKEREHLIKLATNAFQPAWYCYYHECQAVAVFILYPLIKLLNPNQQIFLYKGVFHTFLVLVDQETIKLVRDFSLTDDLNKACVVDLISQCFNYRGQLIFPTFDSMYPNYNFGQWLDHYGGTADDFQNYHRWRSQLDRSRFEADIYDPKRQIPETDILSWYVKRYSPVINEDAIRVWFNEVLNLH